MFSRKHHPFSRSWMPTSLHRWMMRAQSRHNNVYVVSLSGRDAASVRVTVQTPHHGLPGAAAGDALRGDLLTLGCDKKIKTNLRYF